MRRREGGWAQGLMNAWSEATGHGVPVARAVASRYGGRDHAPVGSLGTCRHTHTLQACAWLVSWWLHRSVVGLLRMVGGDAGFGKWSDGPFFRSRAGLACPCLTICATKLLDSLLNIILGRSARPWLNDCGTGRCVKQAWGVAFKV